MHYYEIGLGAEKYWGTGVFTYSSDDDLITGSIVRVPFRKQKKYGIVLKTVEKPDFPVKEIDKLLEIKITKQTFEFMEWYTKYYNAEKTQVYSQFLPNYLTANQKTMDLNTDDRQSLPALSKVQSKALEEINSTKKPSVLHGITGAGKTRIYTHLLIEQLKSGKNALLLYPEISLTSQIVNELKKYAPVIVFHSQLTNAERSKLWYSVATKTQPCIIIGPRSAIFLPYLNLGIVIIDEAHESSYKQENDVRYSSIYTAAGLCASHTAKLVLGSATPPVSETEHILGHGGNLVCLHHKALKFESDEDKEVLIIDAKKRDNFSIHPLISDTLIKSINCALDKNEQIILFINRRGTAKLVLCGSADCDWQAECEHCELPMTYHHDAHQLVCHTCGRKKVMPTTCPVCSNKTELKSLGSKAIVEDITKLFPAAKIARFDSDTEKTESFNQNYDAILAGSVDILIGTQQLIKGLDLPKLSTIGILNADLSLHFPDYTSDERTFQLVTQAMGRVGRGHNKGCVVVQTFQPNNPTITWAIAENWHGFRDNELASRRLHSFPPYSFYAKLLFRDKNIDRAEKKANICKGLVSRDKVNIDGPLPSFTFKRSGFYYVQLLIKARTRTRLLEAIRNSPKDTIIDLDPANLL